MTTPDERLHAAVAAAGGAPRDVTALAAAARAELAAHPRARRWWVDALVVLGFNALLGLAAALSMSWSDQQHHSVFTKYAVGIAWFVVMSVGSVLWLKPGPVRTRWSVVIAFAAAAVLTLFGASGVDSGNGFMSGMWCAMTECVIAAVPVTLVLVLSLRFAASRLHLVAGSLAAGSGAALALHFHCSNGTVLHLLVWHLLPTLVLAAIAVGVRALLRPRTFVP